MADTFPVIDFQNATVDDAYRLNTANAEDILAILNAVLEEMGSTLGKNAGDLKQVSAALRRKINALLKTNRQDLMKVTDDLNIGIANVLTDSGVGLRIVQDASNLSTAGTTTWPKGSLPLNQTVDNVTVDDRNACGEPWVNDQGEQCTPLYDEQGNCVGKVRYDQGGNQLPCFPDAPSPAPQPPPEPPGGSWPVPEPEHEPEPVPVALPPAPKPPLQPPSPLCPTMTNGVVCPVQIITIPGNANYPPISIQITQNIIPAPVQVLACPPTSGTATVPVTPSPIPPAQTINDSEPLFTLPEIAEVFVEEEEW